MPKITPKPILPSLTPPDLSNIEIRVLYERALDTYCDPSDNDIELDDLDHYLENTPVPGRFSEGVDDEGVWIQAWLWLPKEEDDEDA
jgi:hypothetical protein